MHELIMQNVYFSFTLSQEIILKFAQGYMVNKKENKVIPFQQLDSAEEQ